MTVLSIDIRHSFVSDPEKRDPDGEGGFALNVHFASDARAVALSGPSGAGKSTILNVIAGLLKPDAARVIVGDVVLIDTAQGLSVPISKRRVGYVFQDGRLFPHLTVRQNLLFGRWFARNRESAVGLDEVVELLGVGHLLGRWPGSLSGGEKQRIAIGRALLSRPRLLLMDEPLTALDAARRQRILPLLERIRDELAIPMVFVSHDAAEIARIAKDVVQIDNGRVVGGGGRAGDTSDEAKVARLDAYRSSATSHTLPRK